jgi:hypothetical protein
LKITHCVFNFEKLEVGYDLIAFSLLLPSIYTNPTSLVPYSTKKTSKNEHWGWALRCSLLTIGFKLENGLWLFVKIMRHKLGISGHLLHLINICRKFKVKILFFNLKSLKSKSGHLLFGQPVGRGNFVLFQNPTSIGELYFSQSLQQY